MQLKLLHLLALLGQGDKAASENMFQIVGDTLRRASTSHTIGNAIICEAVRTITSIYPNQILLRSGAPCAAGSARSCPGLGRPLGADACWFHGALPGLALQATVLEAWRALTKPVHHLAFAHMRCGRQPRAPIGMIWSAHLPPAHSWQQAD